MPFNYIPGGFCLCPGAALTCEQAKQFQDSILHKEESHGIKKYSRINSCINCLLPGEPEVPVWGLMPRVQVRCYLEVPTKLFRFWWPFLIQPAGLGPGYTVGESKLTQAFLTVQTF